MLVFSKKDLANYRFAIAKVVFLQVYREFNLLEGMADSSCMLVLHRDQGLKLCISLLQKPEKKEFLSRYPFDALHIYYQKAHYQRQKDRAGGEGEIFLLSEEFDRLFQEYLVAAFLRPEEYKKQEGYDLYRLLSKSLAQHSAQKSGCLYKYYAKSKVADNGYGVNDGCLSFSPPMVFNDPFDCGCRLANNKSMEHVFKVLCLTECHRNILMWSYYADNHKGYCFAYDYDDIMEGIRSLDINGICIAGEVQYKKKRPEQKAPQDKFSYTDILFYIEAAFTKYEEWKHEKEYRFVILSDGGLKSVDFVSMQITPRKVYEGVAGDKASVKDSKDRSLEIRSLAKDDTHYALKGE